MKGFIRKIKKFISLIPVGIYREALLKGVAAATEHQQLLKNYNLNSNISKIFKKNCFKLKQSEALKRNFHRNQTYKIIPIVNEKNIVVDLIDQNKKNAIPKEILKRLEVVIMAGGLGTRLRPYTNILPKPLIPFKNKTIIENVIDNFLKFEINKFYLSINYKNYLISSFFKELSPKYRIKFLVESKPLGTAGSLYKLQNKKNKLFFVTNCDTLIDIDLYELIKFHQINKYDLTLVSSSEIFKIPYGVCKIKNNKLGSIEEKPQTNYLANTGFYLINSNFFKLIKNNQNLSFVDLIKIGLKRKKRIGVYPISSKKWQDLGQSISFEK